MTKIKTISVTVEGFPPFEFSHVSASAAFAEAWRSYQNAYECTFKEFMMKARRITVDNPDGVGVPVCVCGKNAWTIEPLKHTTRFVYDGEKTIMTAHHTEIERGHLET